MNRAGERRNQPANRQVMLTARNAGCRLSDRVDYSAGTFTCTSGEGALLPAESTASTV